MNASDILDRDDLMQIYKVTTTWIREHGRASGGVGKPMTWLRSEFEDYYFTWRTRERQRYLGDQAAASRMAGNVNAVVRSISAARSRASSSNEMRGKGGRIAAS